jgi:tetratricopeptide (TPR) repeat protein
MNVDELLEKGIEAIQSGNLQDGSGLLAQVVQADPNREQAWLWLGRARSELKEKEFCFNRVLSLNPGNPEARFELERLKKSGSKSVSEGSAAAGPEAQRERSMANTDSQPRYQRIIALSVGLVLGVLVCSASLLFLGRNSKFEQYARESIVSMRRPGAAQSLNPGLNSTAAAALRATATGDLTFKQRFALADPYITQAFNAASQNAPAEAIQAWDQALGIVPEYATGYYFRGTLYMDLLSNQRSLEEYKQYLARAGSDFDKAIALEPMMDGGYYLARYKYYDALALAQGTRADFLYLDQIAYENLAISNQLGNYDNRSSVYAVIALVNLNRCNEALALADKQLQELAVSPAITLDLYSGQSIAYYCKGDLKNALESVDKAIAIKEDCSLNFQKAEILYAEQSLDEAVNLLDKTFGVCPNYFGERYYLRGLIYADQGKLDLSRKDLSFGSGQTWSQGGLLPYAAGKLALASGDRGTALKDFQQAEETYLFQGPMLEKIRQDVTKLGGLPLNPTPSFASVTPIPTPTIQVTPRPISTLATPPLTPEANLNIEDNVDITKSVGPLQIDPTAYLTWRFQPAQAIPHKYIQTLTVWILSSDLSQKLPTQIFVWDFANNRWGAIISPVWGENTVDFPNDHVSRDGDVIIHIQGQIEVPATVIESLGVRLTVQKEDNSIEIIGFTP